MTSNGPIATMNNSETPRSDAIRLNRYLAQCGLGARRKCDELICSGHVYVNGSKVTNLATRVSPSDAVAYCGRSLKPVRRLEYIAFHKPASVMVTRQDPEGRPTVYDAMRDVGVTADHLNYVGRLDCNSEGLLLFTNDGSLIHALTHPRYNIKKVYHVKLDRALTREDQDRLGTGIESEGQVLHAGEVRTVPSGKFEYEVDLYEGKNRQLRRMFEKLDYKIMRLIRIRFASVRLADLRPGAVRPLTSREIAALKSAGYPEKRSP
ncbi:MAG: pseudouridine synthase [Chitinispirillaceae bacterium]|jgi:23S rRNA pseudouridine2605 synthase